MNTNKKTPLANMPSDKEILATKKIKKNVLVILEDMRLGEILSLQVNSLDSLVIFNDKSNDIISEMIIDQQDLNLKPKDFIEAFKTSNLSKFTGEESEKDLIMDLIEEKKSIYQKILLESIKRGNFHFPKNDLEDLISLVNSGIFEWKDSLYRDFSKKIMGMKDISLGKELFYGMPKGTKAGTYKESILNSDVSPRAILEINNPSLKDYLREIVGLSTMGNNEYAKWIRAEKNEVDSWLSDDNIVFIAPMENYNHDNFVDPEFLILLREKTGLRPELFSNLSNEHFKNDYGMGKVNVYYSEEILKGGNASFSQFLGKSFPNDSGLRNDFGNFILIVKGQFSKTFDTYYKDVSKIFTIKEKELLSQKDDIVSGAMEETIYHEYGHSLFGVKSTDLEEAKATMFYWVHLFDKYQILKEELNIEEIKKILLSFTLDFTRYISRMEKSKYRKYVYTAQIILHYMLKNGLLAFDADKNCLNMNIENEENTIANFKALLNDLRGVTDDIKDIYGQFDKENKEDVHEKIKDEHYTTAKAREENVTKYYNDMTWHILESLYKNFN